MLCIFIIFFLSIILADDSKIFEEMIKDLQSSDYFVRMTAIENLGIFKDRRAIKPLEEAFFKGNWEEKHEVINALRLIHHPDAIKSFIKMLQDPGFGYEAAAALSFIEPNWRQRPEAKKAFDSYVLMLQEKGYKKRAAIIMVALIDPDKALKPVLNLFIKRDLEFLNEICASLGLIKSKESLQSLIDYFFDWHYPYIKSNVSDALDKIDPDWRKLKYVKDKIPILLKELEKQTDKIKKIIALSYCELLKNSETIPFLIKMANEGDYELRCKAIYVLAAFKEKRTQSIILRALNDKDKLVKQTAIQAIGNMGLQKYCPLIIDRIKDKDKFATGVIIDSICKLRCESALESLIKIAGSNEDSYIKQKALSAIVMIGNNTAVPKLMDLIKQRNYDSYYSDRLIDTLMHFQDNRIADSLIPILIESRFSPRAKEIELLGRLKDPRALELLQKALLSKDLRVRAYAEWAIWNIQNQNNEQ